MVGQEDKRTNNRTMFPALKNNAAAGYQGPVKKELLKGAGLVHTLQRLQRNISSLEAHQVIILEQFGMIGQFGVTGQLRSLASTSRMRTAISPYTAELYKVTSAFRWPSIIHRVQTNL